MTSGIPLNFSGRKRKLLSRARLNARRRTFKVREKWRRKRAVKSIEKGAS